MNDAKFNNWNKNANFMEPVDNKGVFECFIPFELPDFSMYKFCIETYDGKKFNKIDPYAYHFEKSPGNSCKFFNIDGYKWNDKKWEESKKKQGVYDIPINIYEVHFESFKKYKDGNNFSYRKMEL